MRLKFYLLFVIVLVSVSQIKSQVRIGAEVGVNASSLAVKDNQILMGPSVGITADYLFNSGWVLQSGLYYTMKGAAGIWNDHNYRQQLNELKVRTGYIELPVMLGYRLPLINDVYLTPSLGAYFAYGVNGNGEVNIITTNESTSRFDICRWNNPFKSNEWEGISRSRVDGFERFDSGLRFGLNLEVRRFVVSFAYDLGLKKTWSGFDTESYKSSTYKLKNRTAFISLGYKFSL